MSNRAFLLLVVVLAVGRRLEASSEVSSRGFMDRLMSMNGCGRFAGLVNATANATRIFQYSSIVHGGLVIFCPDDKAVAAFEPVFNDLCSDGQLAVLRYHGVAPATFRQWRRTKTVFGVSTLASDLAWGYFLSIRDSGDTMELSSLSGGTARVTKMVTGEEDLLVVYLIDAVLLPRESIDCSGSSFDEGLLWTEVLKVVAWSAVAFLILFAAAVVVFIFMAVLWLGGWSVKACSLKPRAVHPLPSSA